MTTQELNRRMAASESRIFKAVFPNTTNHYDTLFGGTALSLMDEVAFIAATRFSRKKMVTVSSSRVDFKMPIPHGRIIELVARVADVGRTSVVVKVEIYIEEMYSEGREKAIEGEFKMVAVNAEMEPVAVLEDEEA